MCKAVCFTAEVKSVAKDLNLALLYDFYNALLSSKQSEILDLYYNEDLSLAEISDHLGITRQGVHDNIKRAETIMTDAENALGLLKKHKASKAAAEEILDIIAELEEYEEIKPKLQKIKDNLKIISE